MMTPVAHRDEGSFSAHKVGSEVLVDFIDGDIDRPVIMGALYNGHEKQPYKQPGEVTRSSWKVRSIPGGKGYNEITFEKPSRQGRHPHPRTAEPRRARSPQRHGDGGRESNDNSGRESDDGGSGELISGSTGARGTSDRVQARAYARTCTRIVLVLARIADTFTVLRDGHAVGSGDPRAVPASEIITHHSVTKISEVEIAMP